MHVANPFSLFFIAEAGSVTVAETAMGLMTAVMVFSKMGAQKLVRSTYIVQVELPRPCTFFYH